jgi:hypothetical protein
MGPVSLVVSCRQKFSLSLLFLLLRVGEKLDGDPEISQPECWGCSREFLFLWSSGIYLNLSVTHERLLCVDRIRYILSRTICGLSVGYVWHVGRVSPAGCTSIRIVATLKYE